MKIFVRRGIWIEEKGNEQREVYYVKERKNVKKVKKKKNEIMKKKKKEIRNVIRKYE